MSGEWSEVEMRCRFIQLFGEKTPAFLEGLIQTLPSVFSAVDRAHFREMKEFRDSVALWARMDMSILFPVLCYVLFAHKPVGFEPTQAAVEEILEALPRVIDLLVAGPLSSGYLLVIWRELTVVGRAVENPAVGVRKVSVHAWRRFCERGSGLPQTYRKKGACFLRYFEKARFQRLCCEERYGRLLNNGVKEAWYLKNETLGLRFVVTKQAGGNVITVEKPYCG